MKKIKIEVNALAYRRSLSNTISNLIKDIQKRNPVKAVDLFDTDAFSPKNPTGREQLLKRADFLYSNELWTSKSGIFPLKLQYQLNQREKNLKIDVKAKGDMILKTNLEIENNILSVTVLSKLETKLLDPVIIDGQEIALNEKLFLSKIDITDTYIKYFFRKDESTEIFLFITAIYNKAEVERILKGQFINIEVETHSRITDKIINTFIKSTSSIACVPTESGEHTLWARSSNGRVGNGICYISKGCGTDTNPRAPQDVKLGCYESYTEASDAMNMHPMCGLANQKDYNPFDMAKQIK